MPDEEFETFQSVEQFCESDSESMVAPQLLAEEDHGQDGMTPFGVGLEVSGPLAVAGGQSQQPQDERSQGGDEQQGLEPLGAFRARVAQCEPESVALEVANGLFDLHALGVDAFDPGADTAVMRQRGGEQPWGVVHLSILRATSSALVRPARTTTKGAHQIQPAPLTGCIPSETATLDLTLEDAVSENRTWDVFVSHTTGDDALADSVARCIKLRSAARSRPLRRVDVRCGTRDVRLGGTVIKHPLILVVK